jgi:hypothetical protein
LIEPLTGLVMYHPIRRKWVSSETCRARESFWIFGVMRCGAFAMTSAEPNQSNASIPARSQPGSTSRILPTVTGLLLGVVAGGLCWWAAGPSLGLFLGGVLLSAILIPSLVAAESKLKQQLASTIGVVTGIAAVWLVATLAPHPPGQPLPSLLEWLECTAVLTTFALALGGMTATLVHVKLNPSLASFLTLLVAAAWLAWPVWLSPALPGHDDLVHALAIPHPLVAINSVLPQMGLWTQQPLAYHLTTLNHDVALPMPGGIGWTVGVHGLIGAALISGTHWRRKQRAD